MCICLLYDAVNPHKDTRIEGRLGNMGILTHGKPSNRERESA